MSVEALDSDTPRYLHAVLNLRTGFDEMAGYSLGLVVKLLSVFLRSYLCARYENLLDVHVIVNDAVCEHIFSSDRTDSEQQRRRQWHGDDFGIPAFLSSVLHAATLGPANPACLAACLSRILCCSNRQRLGTKRADARILVVNQGDIASSQYVSFMNVVFEAQRHKIRLDVVDLRAESSVLLKQGAAISGGTIVNIHDPRELLPLLIGLIKVNGEETAILNLPRQRNVDFRGSCFCHGRIVDIGFVCSVCLSVFCTFSPFCKVCKTKFNFARS